jgi:hypothetical protein
VRASEVNDLPGPGEARVRWKGVRECPYLRARRPKIKHDGKRRQRVGLGGIVCAVIKMALCMAKKKPDQEPGLNLFSEENRGDRCNYALRKIIAIIERSNMGYHQIEYFAATPVSF